MVTEKKYANYREVNAFITYNVVKYLRFEFPLKIVKKLDELYCENDGVVTNKEYYKTFNKEVHNCCREYGMSLRDFVEDTKLKNKYVKLYYCLAHFMKKMIVTGKYSQLEDSPLWKELTIPKEDFLEELMEVIEAVFRQTSVAKEVSAHSIVNLFFLSPNFNGFYPSVVKPVNIEEMDSVPYWKYLFGECNKWDVRDWSI